MHLHFLGNVWFVLHTYICLSIGLIRFSCDMEELIPYNLFTKVLNVYKCTFFHIYIFTFMFHVFSFEFRCVHLHWICFDLHICNNVTIIVLYCCVLCNLEHILNIRNFHLYTCIISHLNIFALLFLDWGL